MQLKLAAEAVNKNDPSDARPVVVTALRSRMQREAAADDHSTVLKAWSKHHHDLGRNRTQIACRLHAALCERGQRRNHPRRRRLILAQPGHRLSSR